MANNQIHRESHLLHGLVWFGVAHARSWCAGAEAAPWEGEGTHAFNPSPRRTDSPIIELPRASAGTLTPWKGLDRVHPLDTAVLGFHESENETETDGYPVTVTLTLTWKPP